LVCRIHAIGVGEQIDDPRHLIQRTAAALTGWIDETCIFATVLLSFIASHSAQATPAQATGSLGGA
jgi:predicted Co/Zn/Cd cation transporter (cation efflux family)